MVVRDIAGENSSQVGFVDYDDMSEALVADIAVKAFRVRILPWRSWCYCDFFDSHVLDPLAEKVAVHRIPVPDQEPRRLGFGTRFDHLLRCPLSRWMRRDVEVDDHATMMAECDEAKQDAKRRRPHRERS